MNNNFVYDKLKYCLYYGVFAIVIRTMQHLDAFKLIGKNKDLLQNMEDKDRQFLYYYLQVTSQRLMILETAKLYDNYSNRNETLSLNYFFHKLEQFKPEPIAPLLFESKKKQLKNTLFDKEIAAKFENVNQFDFLTSLRELAPKKNKNINEKLVNVKTMRDKVIAHNEKVNFDIDIETEAIETLLNYAHDIAQIFYIFFVNSPITWSSRSVNAFFVRELLKEDFGKDGFVV